MDAKDIRRQNLRALATSIGGLTALSDRLGVSLSQVSQIIGKRPVRGIGDTFARKVESAFKLDHGWLDRQHAESDGRTTAEAPPVVASPLLRDALELALAWQELPDQERARVRRLILNLHAQHRQHESRTREQWELLLDDIRANNQRFAESLHDETAEDDSRGVGSTDDRARATQGAGNGKDVPHESRRGRTGKRPAKKGAR